MSRKETRVSFVNDLVVRHQYQLAGLDDDGALILANKENKSMIRVDEVKALCVSGHYEDSSVILYFDSMTVAGDGDRHYNVNGKRGFDIREGRPCWNNYFAKEA